MGFAFSARSGPPLPATEIRVENTLLLDAARAGDRLVTLGERGNIFVSEDAGRGWRRVNSGLASTLTGLAFADARVGLAVGHDATILRTEDGGLTWNLVFSAPDQRRPLLDVAFIAPDHALAVGAYAAFFESRDAGKTWQERQIGEGDRHFNAITRIAAPPANDVRADGALLLVGEAGTLLRSVDAGASWQALASPYAGSFFGIQPLPSGAVLVYGMRGALLRSEDGGVSWRRLENQGAESLLGSVVDGARGVSIVGQNGVILHSQDGGATFQRFLAPGRPMLTAGVSLPAAAELLTFGDAGVLRQSLAAGNRK